MYLCVIYVSIALWPVTLTETFCQSLQLELIMNEKLLPLKDICDNFSNIIAARIIIFRENLQTKIGNHHFSLMNFLGHRDVFCSGSALF